MDARLRALSDLNVSETREGAGRHEYDGQLQDLSPDGVRRGLDALHAATETARKEAAKTTDEKPPADAYDEALVAAATDRAVVLYDQLELYRSNPLYHVGNLDMTGYDRGYGPAPEREEAKRRHLKGWPDAVDAALSALDRVPAPVAEACLGPADGIAAGLDAERSLDEAHALEAHGRFMNHLRGVAENGPAETAMGSDSFRRLLSATEAIDVDLTELATIAERERDRMRALLTNACAIIGDNEPVGTVVARLLADHPDEAGILDEARALTAKVLAWTAETHLAPADGECLVEPAPEARRWAMASISPAAPYESDNPSHYYVTGPDRSWSAEDQEDWLSIFSRTTLPVITVHEVAPGHFSHYRAMRKITSDPRRLLQSDAFIEGWAHYTEELAYEEGFHAADPRFAAGVALEALVRLARLSASIGLHTGSMTVAEAAELFTDYAYLRGPAALSEARRGTFDPTYGRYTWGKLEIQQLRARARGVPGPGLSTFTLPSFHHDLLALGAPPLGLMPLGLGLAE